MGWASGSELAVIFVNRVKRLKKIPYVERVKVYKAFIAALQSHDWDTENECRGMDEAFDEALGPEDGEDE